MVTSNTDTELTRGSSRMLPQPKREEPKLTGFEGIVNLTLRENYWDSPELKKEFMGFLVQLFDLDLSLWDKMGFWDDRYRPFSYFSDNRVVSNVCVYTMDMTIRGERRRVAQISAVGTVPEYRRRGLSRKLTQVALDWARANHDFFFLFADEDAYKLYKECGFRPAEEYKTRIAVTGKVAQAGATTLDMQRQDHVEQVYRLASRREAVSNLLGVSNDKLLMYWCLYSLRNYIHYIPALDILVLFKRENGLVTIFDIVGAKIPKFAELYPHICDPSDNAVEFLFMVDKLGLENVDRVRVEGNGTHLLGSFPLEGTQFILPITSHA